MEQAKIIPIDGGFACQVIDGDSVLLDQPFKSGVNGIVPMTEAEALEAAERFINRPRILADAIRPHIGQTVTVSVVIGPEGYAGTVKWFEGDTLLGEVNAANRSAVLEYTPDAAGTVTIRAGNDVYGFAEVRLEVVA